MSVRARVQGRLARAGELEDKDLDAMLRGALQPVWHWVFRNVKNADDMEIIRRNVRVAQQQIASCKSERDAARAQREALESRKQYLVDAVARAKERDQQLLHSLRALELEDARVTQSLAHAKQRDVLKRAFVATQHDAFTAVAARVQHVHETLAIDSSAAQQRLASLRASNPVSVLLREYVRMVAAGDADVVDFGDTDIAHLRDFGGRALLEWLHELAAAGTATTPESDATSHEDAEYAAHVAAHAGSSRDALAQVQTLLRETQQQHIAQFVETQTLYARAQQLRARVHELTSTGAMTSHDDDDDDMLWADGGARTEREQQRIAASVRLEIDCSAHRAALAVAQQSHATLLERIAAMRQQRAALDDKLALLQSFDARHRAVLEQLSAMRAQNSAAAHAVVDRAAQMQRAASEQLHGALHGRSAALLAAWQQRQRDELCAFATARLERFDTTVRSVPLTHSNSESLANGNAAAAAAMHRTQLAVPFADLFVNQLQRACDDDNMHSEQHANGLARVLTALRVPVYSSWRQLLALLQRHDACADAQTLQMRLELLERDAAAVAVIGTGGGGDPATRAQAVLADVQRAVDALQLAAFPLLERVVDVNTETLERVLARLHTVIDDWYEQSGWRVQLHGAASS